MSTPKPIQIAIEAIVKGQRNVDELAGDLRTLGDVLDEDLKEHALEAAKALEALGSKQRALESFKTLGGETRTLSAEFRKAKTDVEQMGAQLGPAAKSAQLFAQAETAAKDALSKSSGELAGKKSALQQLRQETDAAGKKTQEFKLAEDGLKASMAAAKGELSQRKALLQQAGTEAKKAAQAEAALQQEYKGAVGNVRAVSQALQVKRAALRDTTEQMGRLGVSTKDLGVHERNLKNAIGQVRQEVERMAPAYQQSAAAAKTSAVQQLAATRTLRDGLGDVGKQIQSIQRIAMLALGGNWAMTKAGEVAAVADEFKNLQARVKLATGEGALFASSWQKVSDVALQTHTNLGSTATLFARVTDAGKNAGLATEAASAQALGLTESINKALQLSGGSVQAADAAVTQLIQGLQSGVLRGEEFNSVMEQAPRLAKALADGLGVTTGELRKMANAGSLTTDVVIKSLQSQADVLKREFETLPSTVGRALQDLRTQWTLYVGSADAGVLSTESAAKAIHLLAENLDTIVNGLQTAGKLFAALKIAQLAGEFGAWATKTLSATVAIEANTVATAANTAVQKANAAAVSAGAAAMGAQAGVAKASAFVQAQLAKNAQNVAIFSGQAAKAQQAANAAVAAGGAAAAGAAPQMGLLGSAVRGVTGLLGGPVGLLATVVLFNQEIKSGIQGVVDWGMGFTEAGRKLKAFEEEQQRSARAAQNQKEMLDEAASAAARYAAKQEAARNATFELSKQGQGLIATFYGVINAGDSVNEALTKIGKDFDLSSQMGIQNATAVLDRLLEDGKITAEQFAQSWQTALDGVDLGVFEVQARAALGGSAREAERLAQVMDATVRQAVERTGLDFDNLQGRISAVSRSAINDVQAIAGSFGRLKEQGVDAATALQAAMSKAINTADSKQALDALIGQVGGLRTELGKTVSDGLLDQAANKAKGLQLALEEATPGIQSVQEAMRQLGVTTDASLKETAEVARQAYEVVRDSGTATPREIALAFEKAGAAAEASADRAIVAWAKAEKDRLRYQNLKPAPDNKPNPEKKPDQERKPGRDSRGERGGLNLTKEDQERIDGLRDSGDHLVAANELRKIKWRQELEANREATQGRSEENNRLFQEALEKVADLKTGGSDRDLLAEMLGNKNPLQSVFPKGAITFQMPAAPMSAAAPGAPGMGAPAGVPAAGGVLTQRHEIVLNGRDMGAVPTNEEGGAALERLLQELERGAMTSGGVH